MKPVAIRELFQRIEPALPVADEGTPPMLAVFLKLGLPLSAVARAIGVTEGAMSQWRSRMRPIPRPRQIEMMAILVLIQARLERLAARVGDPDVRAGMLRDVATVDALLTAEVGRRRPGAQAEQFAVDLVREVQRTRAALERVLRPMWRAADQPQRPRARKTMRIRKPSCAATRQCEA